MGKSKRQRRTAEDTELRRSVPSLHVQHLTHPDESPTEFKKEKELHWTLAKGMTKFTEPKQTT